MPRLHSNDAIREEVASITLTWLEDAGGKLVKKAVQKYNSELLRDTEKASALQIADMWHANKKLQRASSVTSVQCPALDAVTWCTKQISVLEQRFFDIEQELRCELEKHVEFERSSTASLTEMEALREETRTSHVSIMQEQESTQVVADDPIRLALNEVTSQEDLGSLECGQSSELRRGSESAEVQVDQMRNDYHYELQPSVWDAVLFIGIKGFYWHEHLIMGAAYLVNCILQGVFCMVVVHLGSAVALEDASTTDLEVWREQAQPWEVTGVCGPSLDYSLTSSYLQVSFVHVARDYSTEAILGFSLGPVLTVTVIALWSGTTVKNVKSLVDFTVALLNLTDLGWYEVSMQFSVENKTIRRISLTRFVWMISVVLEQASVIAILSVYGCLWMALSISVSELLLNSVSLAFITDTDELVFETILPTIVKKSVKETRPLRLPRKPQWLSFVHVRSLASLSTIIMFASFFEAFPVSQTTRRITEAILALCGN